MAVLKFNTKLSIRQAFDYLSVQFDDFLGSGHSYKRELYRKIL
jgi:hypothetical protein